MLKMILILTMTICLCACGSESEDNPMPVQDSPARTLEVAQGQYFVTANGPVEFFVPAGWFQSPGKHPYDLQVMSEDQQMNTGVFLFKMQDLAQTTTPQDLLHMQVEDLESKRENFKVVEEQKTEELDDKTLTTVVYSGEKSDLAYYYRFALIEFEDHPDLVPIVLQVAIPSNWPLDKFVLEGITASARVQSDSDAMEE
ncbi:MAG: hypothetical protein ACOCVL_00970 [Candidatus Sumerlaeota bacterium]